MQQFDKSIMKIIMTKDMWNESGGTEPHQDQSEEEWR